MAVDSISAAGEPQLTGDVTLSAGSGIALTQVGQDIEIAAVPEPALQRYIDFVMGNSPVAYWPMDDASGLPQDISGNGNHMTAVSGTPVYQQAGPWGAGSIDEAIQYPSTAFHERATVSTEVDNMSVDMWVRRSGNTSGDLFRQSTTSGGFEIEFTNTTGTWRVNCPGVGTLGVQDETLSDNTWYHIAVTRGATAWYGYVNGRGEPLGTASPAAPVGNTRIVGAGATSVRIAHLAFYDNELSGADVAARYLIASGAV